MVKLIVKGIAFSLLILASCALITWVLIPNNPNAYQAATADKLRLAAETPSPKVLLVGGSNLAFSVDSRLIVEALDRPVVNMGMAKATGLQYMLEEAKPYVQAGDLVILAPEYELFYDLYYGSESLIALLQHYPGRIRDVTSFGEYRTIASNFTLMMQMKFSGYIRSGVSSLENEVYRRDGFNEYGDLTTHIDEETAFEDRSLIAEDAGFEEDAIRALNDFAAHAEERGARVVFTYPSLYDVYYERYESIIRDLDQRLRRDLTFPVISTPAEYTFPYEQLYDTPYHLLRHGRQVRTERLVRDVQAYLDENGGGR